MENKTKSLKKQVDKNEENVVKPLKEKSLEHKSNKSFITTLLLAIFFGYLGIHRFYTGKIATALIWLFTLGLFGVGYIADIIIITSQTFDDINGNAITI